MKKITWKQQLLFGILLIVAGNVLAFLFHKGFFTNLAWGLYGLLFIVHPLYPKAYENNGNKAKWGGANRRYPLPADRSTYRICGVTCPCIGDVSTFPIQFPYLKIAVPSLLYHPESLPLARLLPEDKQHRPEYPVARHGQRHAGHTHLPGNPQ